MFFVVVNSEHFLFVGGRVLYIQGLLGKHGKCQVYENQSIEYKK